MNRFAGLPWIDRIGDLVLLVVTALSLLLLVGPSLIVVAISFEPRAYISFPPSGFSWRWYQALAGRQQLIDAALVSLRIAVLAAMVCLLFGVPAAFTGVRGRFRGKAAVNAFLLAPQMMPGMVIGIATLFFGVYFAIRASDFLLVASLSVFCIPFVVRVVMARLAGLGPRLDEASANLGARPAETFIHVTLPQLTPALVAAGTFTFIEAFDNVTVALFTSDVRARPLSVELYYLVQSDGSPLIAAISTLEIGLSFLALLAIAATVRPLNPRSSHRTIMPDYSTRVAALTAEPSRYNAHDPARLGRIGRTRSEMLHQGEAVAGTLTREAASIRALAVDVRARGIDRVVIAGCGDSWFCGAGVRYPGSCFWAGRRKRRRRWTMPATARRPLGREPWCWGSAPAAALRR